MRTIKINLPDSLNMDSKEAVVFLAAKLYEQGRVTLGQGADLAGMTKRMFVEILGKYGVSIFNYPASDIVNDIKNA